MDISGFTMVRNATILDFPLEASIRSLLPVVSEVVVNIGASEDDTRDRVVAIGDPRIRILDT
ncbi:MAG: glycosyltransferase, partial [Gemmatimonadales bacterium]